ncbi:CLAVATA3/ESR (CLE)-related protein 25-like [Ipomoea triloba]|uniref:CLAVATA3/ESR (CLE)-related protein 25-like n=1 Tax=Ipomoea triloba TaxID=35885 RepID=UPI00125D94CA|nr:CLAVATA3/ESR (CLE)-related protein 25-like [Ipomoea triloba]
MGSRRVKGFWGSVVVIGVIVWLLMVTALQNLERGSMKEVDMRIDENTNFHRKMDLINFISKRRVPNGSDPIHNRKAGNSRRPPGQAFEGDFNMP